MPALSRSSGLIDIRIHPRFCTQCVKYTLPFFYCQPFAQAYLPSAPFSSFVLEFRIMRKPRPRKPTKQKTAKATDTVKVPGTFDQLIAKSLPVKNPPGGRRKAGK